jgi:hypothetical protein
VQGGKGKVRLRLDAASGEHTHPFGLFAASSSSADLPTPASPRRINTALRDARAPSSNSPIRERSRSLP